MSRGVGANCAGFRERAADAAREQHRLMRRAIQAAGIRLVFDRTGAAVGILRQNADVS